MKTLLLLAALVAAPALAEPVKPTRSDREFTVKLTLVQSVEDGAVACELIGAPWDGHKLALAKRRGTPVGCAKFNLDTKVCEIVAPMPRELDDERTRTLGHELLHCAVGRYHE